MLWAIALILLQPSASDMAIARQHYSRLVISHRVYTGEPLRLLIDTTADRGGWMAAIHRSGPYYERIVWVGYAGGRTRIFAASMARPWDGREVEIRRGIP